MNTKKLLFTLAITGSVMLLTTPLFADTGGESSIVVDEDSLFGEPADGESAEGAGTSLEDSLFGEADDSDTASQLIPSEATGAPFIEEISSATGSESSLLVTESVQIGGRYALGGQSTWGWDDPSAFFDNLATPDTDSASVNLSTTLYFDARPTDDFRVFGKTSISYPFDDEGGTRAFDDVFHVDELFSDFNWKEMLFFRGGKHTLNWGVGYFFSPADLLNVTEIDPEDPEAEREGPVSLKAHWPWDVHNAYLYLIANDIEAWDEIGIAGKAELVFGSTELGVGGLYLKNTAPSGMLTVSVPIWDIDFFGEAVVRYGSDRTFVEESDTSPTGVEAATYDDELFYHATAGLSFIYAFDEVDSSVRFSGQYLYNGEGYSDLAVLKDNPLGVGALVGSGEISFTDLMNTGRHYAAANVGWAGIFDSDFSLQAFWLHNFSDMSGYVSPSLSVTLFDQVSLSVSAPYRYGDEGDEYSPAGDGLSLRLSTSLGGGSF
jgi:hypothetical protein